MDGAKVSVVDQIGDGSEIKAYRRIADSCREQIKDIRKSGWFFFSRRCAIFNIEGVIYLCEAWAELAESRARPAAEEEK